MSCTFSWILILSVFLLHSAHSLFLQGYNSETTIPVSVDMLPILDNYTSINSSSIEVHWHPSPKIQGINLTELSGIFTMAVYANARLYVNNATINYPLTKLNETGKIISVDLKSDTVHSIWFQSQWHDYDTGGMIVSTYFPQLVRTYMEDQTTLNPLPTFGEYKWKEIVTNTGTVAIIVNASISPELPYEGREIIVTLGSQSQHQAFDPSVTFVEFEFDLIGSMPKDYPLSVAFTAFDDTHIPSVGRLAVTITRNETVRANTGNKQLLCNSVLLVFLAMLVLL